MDLISATLNTVLRVIIQNGETMLDQISSNFKLQLEHGKLHFTHLYVRLKYPDEQLEQ